MSANPSPSIPLPVMLDFLKVLADENRLKIIGLLSQRAYKAGDVAAALDLNESTVSHHLARLRAQGLLNLNTVGNERHYRLNDEYLGRMKRHFQQIETLYPAVRPPEPDRQWIDELPLDDADRKVLRDYTDADGRLKHIPIRYRKLLAVLRWLALKFNPGVKYTEREVNALLSQAHEDYARLRRELVEAGFLAREGGGGPYWRIESPAE